LGGTYEQYFAGVGHRDRDEHRLLVRTGKSAGKTSGNAGSRDGCAAGNISGSGFASASVSKKRKSRQNLAGSAGCREKDFWI
jgi:hypothetical protein